MRVSYGTMALLAREGDDQAIRVLQNAENQTTLELRDTEFFFEEPLGIFFKPPTRRATLMGMPASEQPVIVGRIALVGPKANRG